ncbi:hypothetical protein F2Q69_00057167 [Brassica cretica]|uniref:THH1/TOM1/TOM3 domain-containing protein n=1 Tax=Brassica cretica TaxID=69181 RepID=A0A8S9MZI9_BRACR|nr:hypothetical protein F2Q69_00057167 [Brassica cretica]
MTNWWEEVNESTQWQDGIFFALCGAYALVSAIALVQLVRIQMRVPEYGWTTQKVFHLMNFVVNGVRAVLFGFHHQVFLVHPKALCWILLDLPGLLFFSAYTLLARSLPTDKLRITYISVNVAVYLAQVVIWVCIWVNDNSTVELVGKLFMSVVSFIAALGFLLYGGRLFIMLRRFPIESKGRRKKLHEVGSVTAICFTCFLIRCIVVGVSAFDRDLTLDVLDHPVLNLIYYMVQLVRIQMRVPEYGWTTQKFALFCLDFTVKYFSSIPRLFAGYYWIFRGSSFSRHTHCSYCSGQRYITRQESKEGIFSFDARSLPTDKLRITYISVNVAVYLAQVVIWVFIWVNDNSTVELVGKIFMSVVSFIAALGFLLYGGR